VKLKISVQVSFKPGTFYVHYYLASHHECRILQATTIKKKGRHYFKMQ